jgi:DNA-directed RNA polymerase subunit H (RpoH/RPB5)
MEDKAIEILQLMLGRRGLKTDVQRITIETLDSANVYQIGDVRVIFSQKQRSLQERDIKALVETRDNPQQLLILVTMVPPSENLLKVIKQKSTDRIQHFHIRELQFDVTTHRYAMPHHIFNDKFKAQHPLIAEQYQKKNITKPAEQLPSIDSQDTMVKWIGAVPGDIVYIERHSDVAGVSSFWRYCVEDTNIA